MKAKKLLLKKDKTGKLKIEKNLEADTENTEDEAAEVEDESEDESLPWEISDGDEAPEGTVAGHMVEGFIAVEKAGKIIYQELVEVGQVKSQEPMANVGFGLDRTINMGDYESLKIHVAIHVPSEVTLEEINLNYYFCKEWTEDKMDEVATHYIEGDDED